MKIVVGVEDSKCSEIAARKAARLAGLLDADLEVVHVAHVPGAVLAAMGGVATLTSDFTEAQREAVWERIDSVVGSAQSVKRVELEGYPPDTLVEYAEETDADLIVVGSRGRGDLASLFLGSTSHRVVHHATCDVLIARGD